MDPQSKRLFCWICLQVMSVASVALDEWDAEVESPVEALVSSCVVLPCKFNYPGTQLPDTRVKGIWHKDPHKEDCIYDEDSTLIIDNFKGRTKLIGRLGDKNCSLEIDSVRDHDNGPFCFRAEIPTLNKYSFLQKCVTINMKSEPDKPTLDTEQTFVEGSPAVFKCYIRHTCPTHHPTIEWNRPDANTRLSYKEICHGVWEVESLLAFTASKEDDHKDITCTVTFHGNMKTAATHKIYIKRKENYFHIIIPVAAVLGAVILFGIACFFVTKRYKGQIQELQSRNPDGVWSRLSRLSHRNYGRMQEPERSGGTKSSTCASTVPGTAGFSKPHFPSPKSDGDRCSAGYGDGMVDLNVYGNI